MESTVLVVLSVDDRWRWLFLKRNEANFSGCSSLKEEDVSYCFPKDEDYCSERKMKTIVPTVLLLDDKHCSLSRWRWLLSMFALKMKMKRIVPTVLFWKKDEDKCSHCSAFKWQVLFPLKMKMTVLNVCS